MKKDVQIEGERRTDDIITVCMTPQSKGGMGNVKQNATTVHPTPFCYLTMKITLVLQVKTSLSK